METVKSRKFSFFQLCLQAKDLSFIFSLGAIVYLQAAVFIQFFSEKTTGGNFCVPSGHMKREINLYYIASSLISTKHKCSLLVWQLYFYNNMSNELKR